MELGIESSIIETKNEISKLSTGGLI